MTLTNLSRASEFQDKGLLNIVLSYSCRWPMNTMNNYHAIDTVELDTADRVPSVLIIGPSEHTIGGMATVVAQQRNLALGNRYNTVFFPITLSSVESESLFFRLVRHVRHLVKLSRTIRQINPAIVHIHTCSGFSFYRNIVDLLIAKMSACSVVLHVHGASFDEFYRSCSSLEKRAIRWSLAQADRVIALSPHWKKSLATMSPRAKIVVIENAVQVRIDDQEPKISRTPSPHEQNDGEPGIQAPQPIEKPVRNRPCRFLMLARMDTWKGVDDLLDALVPLQNGLAAPVWSMDAMDLRNTPLQCDTLSTAKSNRSGFAFECTLAGPAGSAGDKAALNKKIADRSLGACVRYVGPIHGKQKQQWLDWADALVQPSHHEGLPIAMLEAMAAGLPVIATKVGAVPEVITDHVEGLLVAPHSPTELTAALQAIANDLALREKLGRAARQLAISRFGLDRLDTDLVQLYNGLIANPQQGLVIEESSARRSTVTTIHQPRAAHSVERSSHFVPS